ncbi:MAG: hypothetical protein Q7S29_01505 [Candidatus Peribacter sp.]|nr:hypothetical protein [Candidatus Peribacter sp.]
MKRSMIFVGLSLFLLSACGTASVVEGGTEESSSSSSSSISSADQQVPEVDATIDAEGNVVVQ